MCVPFLLIPCFSTVIFLRIQNNNPNRYPPADGAVFARKYLEGCYTYYTAPEESEASVSARMDAQDEALTPMEVNEDEGK